MSYERGLRSRSKKHVPEHARYTLNSWQSSNKVGQLLVFFLIPPLKPNVDGISCFHVSCK